MSGRTSGLVIAKSISIKGLGCRSGGCALKVVELTPGDLPGVPQGTEEPERGPDRRAEVSRGHSTGATPEGPNVRKWQVGGSSRDGHVAEEPGRPGLEGGGEG